MNSIPFQFHRTKGKIKFILVLLFFLYGCATYYQSNSQFNKDFESGNLENALESLNSKRLEGKGKQQFLYEVNNGLILSMLGKYHESNEYFERAYLYGEDYRLNYFNETVSYLSNPYITDYKGEDHEHLLLLYYKALNFLKLGKTEEALVECRRLNVRLQQLSDRFQSPDKYRKDAFIHNLMGIIYEKDKDYNNAFIAYRNALEIYEEDYGKLFQFIVPDQLKEDILRTAFLSGLQEEFEYFKEKFQQPDYSFEQPKSGELIFFWHNGLSPIKTEWGINFLIARRGEQAIISSPDNRFSYTFNIGEYNEREKRDLGSLEFFRVVFPRYVERPLYFVSATLSAPNTSKDLILLEDVNKIAFKCLEERMHIEFSKGLIRAALKKASEYQLKKEDKTLGNVIGLFNVLTEHADTRNWQTLPHSIYYCRFPLNIGPNNMEFKLLDKTGRTIKRNFTFHAAQGEMIFHTFSSLESEYPDYYR